MMSRFDSVREWIETLEKNPKLEGLPAVAVANYLGISRQAISNLVKRERLEEVRVYEEEELVYVMITRASLTNYQKTKGQFSGIRKRYQNRGIRKHHQNKENLALSS